MGSNGSKRTGVAWRRREVLKAGAAAAGAVVATAVPTRIFAQSERALKFTLPWLAQGATDYVYIADDQGMFKKRGLKVEISRGSGSLAAAQSIGNGQFEFGLVSTGATIVAAATGVPLVALGTTNYDAYMGILLRTDSPIRTPKELEGKKVGGVAASAEAPFWPAFAQRAGIDRSKVDHIQADARVLERMLVDKQIDAAICIVSTSYAVAKIMGAPTRAMLWSKYGLTFYSNNICTRPETLAKDPALCGAVTEALLEALAFTLKNPDAALDIFLRKVPELTVTSGGREFSRLSQGFMLASVVRPEAMDNGLGYTDLKKAAEMTDLVMQYGVSGQATRPAPEKLFTNQFVGKVRLSAQEWAEVGKKVDEFPNLLA
jgi:NitT/TauT family transport system substrate-binding protein